MDFISYGRLFSFIYTEAYASTVGKKIENIVMRNVVCRTPVNGCGVLKGEDEERNVENVLIENMTIATKKITNQSAFVYRNAFVKAEIR